MQNMSREEIKSTKKNNPCTLNQISGAKIQLFFYITTFGKLLR